MIDPKHIENEFMDPIERDNKKFEREGEGIVNSLYDALIGNPSLDSFKTAIATFRKEYPAIKIKFLLEIKTFASEGLQEADLSFIDLAKEARYHSAEKGTVERNLWDYMQMYRAPVQHVRIQERPTQLAPPSAQQNHVISVSSPKFSSVPDVESRSKGVIIVGHLIILLVVLALIGAIHKDKMGMGSMFHALFDGMSERRAEGAGMGIGAGVGVALALMWNFAPQISNSARNLVGSVRNLVGECVPGLRR